MVTGLTMPELPEVETVKRGLEPVLLGRRINAVTLRRKDLRFAFPEGFATRLRNAKVEALSRRAKYILVDFDNGQTLIAHLGMTGRFTAFNARGAANLGEFYFETGAGEKADGPHDHVIFDLDDGSRLVYSDPRRFGLMDLAETAELVAHRLLKGLGVEPLGNELSSQYLIEKFRGKSAPLKAALLDQRIIAGLGNIYVCEALHRAGLKPQRKAGSLIKARSHDPRLEALVRHIRDILNEAITAGGSTLQDFASASGEQGSYQQRFSAYDREGEPCHTPNCAGTIKRIVQAGRSSFYCPVCQK
jgi:formamidopyrimidine-DNA glycosylase